MVLFTRHRSCLHPMVSCLLVHRLACLLVSLHTHTQNSLASLTNRLLIINKASNPLYAAWAAAAAAAAISNNNSAPTTATTNSNKTSPNLSGEKSGEKQLYAPNSISHHELTSNGMWNLSNDLKGSTKYKEHTKDTGKFWIDFVQNSGECMNLYLNLDIFF